jgi:hypothetical protein
MTNNLAIAKEIIATEKAFIRNRRDPENAERSVLVRDIQERCMGAAQTGRHVIETQKELTRAEIDFVAHRGFIFLTHLGLTNDQENYRYHFDVKLPETYTPAKPPQ